MNAHSDAKRVSLSRRKFLIGAGAMAGASLLAACGAPAVVPTAVPQDTVAPAPTDAPKTADTGAAFPVTLKHKFGETTITAEPQRVIALGFSDQDPILALGVKPIATRYWWGDEKMAAFPWARSALGDAKPEVLKMQELNFEKLAALKPDLIIATYAGIKAEEFATLSKIAPTVAQSGDYLDYGMPWQETTLTIGKALGREDQAKTLVDDIEKRFAALRAKHPDWTGKSVIIGAPFDGKFGFMASQDPRSRMFTALGFKVPAAFDEIAAGSFFGTLSAERIDLLNTDLIVFHQLQWVKGGRAAIEADPLLSKSESLRAKRAIFLEGELDDAFQFNSVLSLPQVLDKVVPMIETALGGQTATAIGASALDALFGRRVAGYPAYDNIDLIDVVREQGETLTLAHKYGEVDIPKTPKRLVVDHGLLEVCLSLGVKPTAAVIYGEVSPAIKDRLQGIEIVPGGDAVNIETLAALKPDLLIGQFYFGGFDEAVYKQVGAIAPTVILRELPHWSLITRDIAKVLGKQAEAEALFADYTKKLDAVRSRMAPVLGEGSVAMLQVLPENLYLAGPGSELNGKFLPAYFGTFLYRDLGLTPAPVVSRLVGKQEVIDLSLEKLPEIDADVLIVVPTSRPGSVIQEQEIYKKLLASPLYEAIPAVKAGRVYELGPVPESYFTTVDFVEKLADLMTRSA
jgi:iron complex transport system substrate-binding protein